MPALGNPRRYTALQSGIVVLVFVLATRCLKAGNTSDAAAAIALPPVRSAGGQRPPFSSRARHVRLCPEARPQIRRGKLAALANCGHLQQSQRYSPQSRLARKTRLFLDREETIPVAQ